VNITGLNLSGGLAAELLAYFSDTDLVLCLRTCDAGLCSAYSHVRGGFQWPASGPIEAPDWNPEAHCGEGLHGWLWGEGDGSLGYWTESATWIVFAAAAVEVVDLDGKVKVPRAFVLFAGRREEATAWLAQRAPGRAIIGGTATAGDRGTATAGDRGTATAGDGGALVISWWDGDACRWRHAIGSVGEGGIEPGVRYRCEGGRLVPVEETGEE